MAVDSRIVVIAVTEQDIQNQGGWPLSDAVLARTMETVARYGPRAIGLDIYRDVPVPPGSEALAAVFRGDRRIIVVTKFGEGQSDGVPPPAVLKGSDQVGFNDILVDSGGTVRRGLLFLDDGASVLPSFALQLGLLYLQGEGVTAQADPRDPGLLRLGRTTLRPLEPNDGAYVGADTRGYQFLLDFKRGMAPFASMPLTTLLSGGVDPAALRNKVVLIGVTAESVKDNFYTPYSRGRLADQHTAGVAIHAHVASQLLRIGLEDASPMRAPAEWQEAVWILVWSALGGVTGLLVRSPWRLSLVGGGGLLGLGAVDFAAFLGGWWLPLVPPAMTWLISIAVVTAYVSHRETAQRAALMQLFSRHVSKEVAETVWQHRDEFLDGHRPRSQQMFVTALFSDLAGFTTVSEKLAPDALMDWLNEYMDAMAMQVSRHGGVIKQYAGDSIVVMFGVPIPRRSEAEIQRDAVKAVECALAMEGAVRELNARWQTEGRPLTGMRVGIFTGLAVAGSLGSAQRSEYVVVGDTINTASRLESFDKNLFPPDPVHRPCRILIGETTLSCLGDRFETEWVGAASLKGKEQKVEIYRVIGRAQLARAQVYANAPSSRGGSA